MSSRNCENQGKYTKIIFSFNCLKSLVGNLQQTTETMYCGVYNICKGNMCDNSTTKEERTELNIYCCKVLKTIHKVL